MVTVNPQLRSVVDQDGAVILDFERDAMMTLNATGGYVWQKLQQGKLVEEIVRDLASETGADSATVELDVQAFIEQLLRKKLLRV